MLGLSADLISVINLFLPGMDLPIDRGAVHCSEGIGMYPFINSKSIDGED